MATSAELQQLVEDFAFDLSGALPNPAGWGIWFNLLLEELEKQAAESEQPAERNDLALELLKRTIMERLESHQG